MVGCQKIKNYLTHQNVKILDRVCEIDILNESICVIKLDEAGVVAVHL